MRIYVFTYRFVRPVRTGNVGPVDSALNLSRRAADRCVVGGPPPAGRAARRTTSVLL